MIRNLNRIFKVNCTADKIAKQILKLKNLKYIKIGTKILISEIQHQLIKNIKLQKNPIKQYKLRSAINVDKFIECAFFLFRTEL